MKTNLKQLSRQDLLEMLIEQSKEVQSLKEQLHKAEAELESRRVAVKEIGNLAGVVMELNGVFAAAEAASRQYQENIEEVCRQQLEEAQAIRQKSIAGAKKLLTESLEEKKRILQNAYARRDAIIADALRQAQQICDDAASKEG